jgi:hypothetical protein
MYLCPPNWGEVSAMLEEFGAQGASDAALEDAGDARSAALVLMSEALAFLDSDSSIPAVIGAHLQTALDALWASASEGQASIHLH